MSLETIKGKTTQDSRNLETNYKPIRVASIVYIVGQYLHSKGRPIAFILSRGCWGSSAVGHYVLSRVQREAYVQLRTVINFVYKVIEDDWSKLLGTVNFAFKFNFILSL